MREYLFSGLFVGAILLSACSPPVPADRTPNSTVPSSSAPQITLTPEPVPELYVIAEIPMIVRRGAGTGYEVKGQIQPERKYPVLGKHTDWWLVDLGDNLSGWVYDAGSLIRFVGDPQAVPEIAATLMPTLTPLAACTDVSLVEGSAAGLEKARSVLVHFFDLLSRREYERAAALYGGDYQGFQDLNRLIDPRDHVALITNACEINGFACLPVKRIVDEKTVSPAEYQFTLEFMNEDGSLFVLGPCCGGNATDHPSQSQFENRVIKDCTEKFLVMVLYP